MLEIIQTIIGASIPLLLFYFGYLINRRQDKKEGKHRNRVQFDIEAKFFGPQKGYNIGEITIVLNNEGYVRFMIDELMLNIRGIKQDSEIDLFTKKKENEKNENYFESIAAFPKLIVKTNILKRKVKELPKKQKENWFVEPGIVQPFTYEVRIPEDIRFIRVNSSFDYNENSKHSRVKIFEIKVPAQNDCGA